MDPNMPTSEKVILDKEGHLSARAATLTTAMARAENFPLLGWPVDLTAAPIAPAPPAIGAPILSAGLLCPCCRGRGLIQRPDDETRMLLIPSKMNIAPIRHGLAYRIEGCLIEFEGKVRRHNERGPRLIDERDAA
jgi:hypothetical protein